MVEKALKKDLNNITIHKAANYKEAEDILGNIFFHVAIVDVTLPDCKDGDAIDMTISLGIPTIVLTGTTDTQLQTFLLSKNISDLILKNNTNNLAYVVFSVKRVLTNYVSHVLVVDDSSSMRRMIVKLLKKLHLSVFEAADPIEAMEILNDHNNHISMVITDYEMPNMDGLEFTLRLRQKYRKDTLCIIALSAVDEKGLPSKFLRHGANDFLHKPFDQDELFVRVNTNLELLEMFAYTREYGSRDFLTNLYSRQYFINHAQLLIDEATRNAQMISMAYIEIDNLKAISSSNGFICSDMITKKLAQIITEEIPYPCLVSRLSEHTFVALELDRDCRSFSKSIEAIRLKCENARVELNTNILYFTISAGVVEGEFTTLLEIVKEAEKNLEYAQTNGHNKVFTTYSAKFDENDIDETEEILAIDTNELFTSD